MRLVSRFEPDPLEFQCHHYAGQSHCVARYATTYCLSRMAYRGIVIGIVLGYVPDGDLAPTIQEIAGRW